MPMVEVIHRRKSQTPPPWVVWEALTSLEADASSDWLHLADGEIPPTVIAANRPDVVMWSTLWPDHEQVVIALDIVPKGDGSDLTWTILAPPGTIDDTEAKRLRYRMDTLINGKSRRSFGQ